MDWKYKLKRALGNRYGLTAALFLAITLWGAGAALFGALDGAAACKGYAVPYHETKPAKRDPTAPGRALAAAGGDLDLPAKTLSWPEQLRAGTATAEAAVNQALENDHTLIELFGLYQNLTDRTVIEDPADEQYAVVKLPGGELTFAGAGRPDAAAQAGELARLQAALAERGASLLYLQAPSKLEPGVDVLPEGVEDTSNACADALLAQLDMLDVDYLDFRETLRRAGGEWTDWFYATDHHWTQEAAFLCFQELCERLEGYERTTTVSWGAKREPIVIPERYTDPASYRSRTLPGFFLGSQGKRVGSLYGGSDDFVLHTPAFPTLLHYSAGSDGQRYGDAGESVLFPERVAERDWFGATPYTYYAGGDYPLATVENYYNPEGPRILLIRDSFACAMTPYLALISSELVTIDPRSFTGDLLSYVNALRPDVVLVLYSSGMVRDEAGYRLLAQSAPSKSDALMWKPKLSSQK